MTIIELDELTSADKRQLLAERLRAAAPAHVRDVPLSFSQQRLWFLEQLLPGSAAYHVPVAVKLDGEIDLDVWRRCCDEIVRRHEILRTRFIEVDGQLVQRVARTGRADFELIDCSHLPADEREAEVRRVAGQQTQQVFDLATGPLFRVRFLRLSTREHVLLLVMHHIVADLWSMGVAVQELVSLYPAFRDGAPSPLAELPLQYGDYAAWQRSREAQLGEEGLDYWVHALRDAPPVIDLPTDRPRPAVQTSRGGSQPFELSDAVMTRVRALSRAEGATPFMTVLAALAVVLHRYAHQDEVVIGAPIANRTRPEIAGLVGFFVNTLALRVDLSDDPTFRELLARVRTVCLGGFAHQDVPFERLVEKLQVARDLAHSPLFQVSFVYQNIEVPDLDIGGLSVSPMVLESVTSRFDLELQVFDRPDGLSGWFEYNSDLFDAGTIEQIATSLALVAQSVTADPDVRVSTVGLLPETERTHLAEAPNDTAREWPDLTWVHHLVERQAARTPNAPAVSFGSRTASYRELDEGANRLAHRLCGMGVGPGDLVAICTDRTPELVVAILAVLKTGAAYVPLDPSYPLERNAFIVDDSGVEVIVTERAVAELLPDTSARVICADDLAAADTESCSPGVEVTASDVAYVIYTSGSTGRPKGVRIPHGALANFLMSMAERPGIESADTLLAVTTPCFDISILELLLPLTVGARVSLASRETSSDGVALAQLLTDTGTTIMQATPATWQLLLAAGWTAAPGFRALCGGEALTPDLARGLLGAGAAVWNMYGPTETTIWSAVSRVLDDEIYLGEPIANTELQVVDAHGVLVPPGVPGELCIGGAGLALGYLGRPKLTADRFVSHPFPIGLGDQLYRTGDLVRRRTDGRLEFLGRIDHQVKLRGFRIELGEVEEALRDQPGVREAVVVLRADVPEDPQLAAYVVVGDEAASTTEQRRLDELGQWQNIWNTTYVEGAGEHDTDFDISGWTSSYTGEPIIPEQMREWVDQTVALVLERQPRSVLDIGCGSGLILHGVAPNVDRYWGTDFSDVALAKLWAAVAEDPELPSRVELHGCAAHELDSLPEALFDVVLLNSVVQYFPDEDYLDQAIGAALLRVAPGGTLVVGDVRSLPLLEAFHASVEAHRAAPGTDLETIRRRVARRVAEDEELVIDPRFFATLPQRHTQIEQVRITPKRGVADNELTRFRYDVLLEVAAGPSSPETVAVAPEPPSARSNDPWLDWATSGLDLKALTAKLTDPATTVLALSHVPNSRVRPHAELVESLHRSIESTDSGALTDTSTGNVTGESGRPPTDGGIDPEALLLLADRLGFCAEVDWSSHGPDGGFDVRMLRRGPEGRPTAVAPAFPSAYLRATDRSAGWVNGSTGRLARTVAPALKEALAMRLPDYMVPAAVVLLDALPRTPNGKVDRRMLPSIDMLRSDFRAPYEGPRTDLERELVQVWSQVLRVNELSVHDTFFDAGGHSLLATSLIAQLRATLGVAITLRDLFEHPTVAAMAAWLDTQVGAASALEPIPRLARGPEVDYPLSFAQEWLLVDHPAGPRSPAHNVVTAARLRGRVDEVALAAALDIVAQRQEALRTRLVERADGWAQQVLDSGSWPLHRCRVDPAQDPAAVVRSLLDHESRTPFGVDDEALQRASLVTVDDEDRILVLTMHHAVTDNWSFAVVMRELAQAYESVVAGRTLPVDPTAVGIVDIAAWQRAGLDAGRYAADAAYWRAVLADLPEAPVLSAHGCLEDPPARSGEVFTLDPGTVAALQGFAHREGATLFMILLAAYAVLVCSATDSRRLAVGFPTAGRDRREMDPLVGFLANRLVICPDLGGDPTFRELLTRVRNEALEIAAHEAIPLQPLRRESPDAADRIRLGFNLLSASLPTSIVPGVGLEPVTPESSYVYVPEGASPGEFDLSLAVLDDGTRLRGMWLHDPDRVDSRLAARLARQWAQLLDRLVGNPDMRIETLVAALADARVSLDSVAARPVGGPR